MSVSRAFGQTARKRKTIGLAAVHLPIARDQPASLHDNFLLIPRE